MVLHTIIGEYDVLYAQEIWEASDKEKQGFTAQQDAIPFSTDPYAYLNYTTRRTDHS